MRVWKPVAEFELMDIGNDFYMVKFDEEVDRTKIMDGGCWMIFEHYLMLEK